MKPTIMVYMYIKVRPEDSEGRPKTRYGYRDNIPVGYIVQVTDGAQLGDNYVRVDSLEGQAFIRKWGGIQPGV